MLLRLSKGAAKIVATTSIVYLLQIQKKGGEGKMRFLKENRCQNTYVRIGEAPLLRGQPLTIKSNSSYLKVKS